MPVMSTSTEIRQPKGVVVDPLWDVVDSIDTIADGMLPGPDAEALEGFLFAALAELG